MSVISASTGAIGSGAGVESGSGSVSLQPLGLVSCARASAAWTPWSGTTAGSGSPPSTSNSATGVSRTASSGLSSAGASTSTSASNSRSRSGAGSDSGSVDCLSAALSIQSNRLGWSVSTPGGVLANGAVSSAQTGSATGAGSSNTLWSGSNGAAELAATGIGSSRTERPSSGSNSSSSSSMGPSRRIGFAILARLSHSPNEAKSLACKTLRTRDKARSRPSSPLRKQGLHRQSL